MTTLKTFEPGRYIRIDDVMSGVRKTALVLEPGDMYLDLDGDDATPFPIYEVLNPEEAGDILSWGFYLIDQHPEHHPAFTALVDKFIASDAGPVFYNRALYWAFTNMNWDYDKAVEEAKKETWQITTGRYLMDTIAKAAGEAS